MRQKTMMSRIVKNGCCAYVDARMKGLWVALALLGADAFSKAWALKAELAMRLPMWLADGVGFHFAWNRGMSFSLLDGVSWGPVLLGVVAIAACVWFFHWLGEHAGWLHQAGLGMLIGGAAGNVVDRVQHGAVVDFLLLNPWGVFPYTFNIADVGITFGVVLLLLDSWLRRA
jgi:lipoprotein signal peptidase